MQETQLYLQDVHRAFDCYKAINGLSIALAKGEMRAVVGPNGAGKTTMLDIITGKTRPDSGEVFWNGDTDLTKMDEASSARLGIGRKFQKPTVFETQTVETNLMLSLAGNRGVIATLLHKLSGGEAKRIDELLELVRLTEARGRLAGSLSHGQKQWLEIGMLLSQEPRVVLLDEPVAGMTDAETDRTAELCLELEKRHTVVVVEHDMEFVAKIARTVTVLCEGSVLAEGPMDAVRGDPRVIEVYLGR